MVTWNLGFKFSEFSYLNQVYSTRTFMNYVGDPVDGDDEPNVDGTDATHHGVCVHWTCETWLGIVPKSVEMGQVIGAAPKMGFLRSEPGRDTGKPLAQVFSPHYTIVLETDCDPWKDSYSCRRCESKYRHLHQLCHNHNHNHNHRHQRHHYHNHHHNHLQSASRSSLRSLCVQQDWNYPLPPGHKRW